MHKIIFLDEEHKNFFINMLRLCRSQDCYHRSLFYVLGLTFETRKNINILFDLSQDEINPDGIFGAWHTATTWRVCHFAFNLWNGFVEDENASSYTPDTLFSTPLFPYFIEALKLRFEDYL